MTTIITIVVVALVFFVTVCIVTFMVWKREAEMRTDSIKAIEHNVEEMLHELTGGSSREIRDRMKREEIHRDYNEPQHETNDRAEEVHRESSREETAKPAQGVQKKPQDQSEWVEAQKVDESVTVFDPTVIQYTSFDRGDRLAERDGKHGLRWKEIQRPQQPTDAAEVGEHAEEPDIMPTYAESTEAHETELQQMLESQIKFIDEPQPESIDEPEDLQPESIDEVQLIQVEDDELAFAHSANYDEPVKDEGGPLSKFLKRHKRDKDNQEREAFREETPPQQEVYDSIEDLLKDYISEPHSLEDDFKESMDEDRYEPEFETHYSEPIKLGYDVGKSGKKYTAAELEALIKE